ncbi:MAG: HAD family hydrolase [Clostridia bacterium]|nr:HAD family hydrolase [Clostridia bacterium]
MRFDNILLLSDLDGTFLNDEVKPVKANIDAVNRFAQNGGLFSVASGRPPKSALRYISECKVNFPAVTYNGAMVYDFEKKQPVMSLMPSDEVRKIAYDVYLRYADKVGFLAYYENDLVTIKANEYSLVMKPFEALNFKEITDYSLFPNGIYKYLYVAQPETIKEMLAVFESEYAGRLRFTSAGKNFIELLAPGADKGSMMEKLVKSRPDVKTVIAIGDYYNDICILEKADIKVAVKGAPKELLDIADYVTKKTNNEGAVADLIDNLEEILSGKAR